MPEKSKHLEDNFPSNRNSEAKPSESADVLENKLQEAEARIRRERFLFFLVSIVYFNCYVFAQFDNWGAPVSITIIELIVIAYAGRAYDIKEIKLLTERIFSVFDSRQDKG